MTAVTLVTCQGDAITPHLEALARLRIRVFRDYPYLYDGDLAYEAEYLGRYAQNPASLFVLAFDGDTLVGASTGQPLKDEVAEFRAPFERADIDPSDVFYYGESVLLHDYRGQGLGKAFIAAREAHARSHSFGTVAFCAVERPEDHPAKLASYRPLHGFWEHLGYRRRAALTARFAWKDIDAAEESEKPLVFWLKSLAG
ncbi:MULTISPECIES: GNAT family N-acetyltransferase [unclassified Halomonas]|uniref:GNAT family N-acetyltransferase n=1 Tax=unclassified Halomonas TaxID=2609666 RepID=UPI0020A1FD40|nr:MULTISPECIES: GNAT family N-acetyltransferase [unclassified Halomonas]MCP1315497.1 GNAT family N-acetyltransferase [Halomonas sp. 707D7]MCP1326880.1 GNAT family N-acetyltransferase [Halomonas sp. 707D4]